MSQIRLSLVIPAYNAEAFLARSLRVVIEVLEEYFQDHYEVIVIDDGSTDTTWVQLETFVSTDFTGRVTIERFSRNQGKFAAIKHGVRRARGSVLAFTDVDLPYSLTSLVEMVQSIERGEVVIGIGDRNLPSSYFPKHPQIIRRIATGILSHIVGRYVTPGFFDTQCGLKACKADVGKVLLSLVQENGFSGDIELLYIAIRYNLTLERFPVYYRGSGPTTVRVFSDGLWMLNRIIRLQRDWCRGVYRSEALDQLRSAPRTSTALKETAPHTV